MPQHLASPSGMTALQVEGLCSMVSGVEELVAKAEKHCTAMQVIPTTTNTIRYIIRYLV